MPAQNLDDILSFVAETLRKDEKPVYRIGDYKAGLHYHESHLRGLPGIEFNASERGGTSWLKVSRLVKEPAPSFPRTTGADVAARNEIVASEKWVHFVDDPSTTPSLKETIRVLLPLSEARQLVIEEKIDATDYGEQNATGRVTTTLHLERFPETKALYEAWLQNAWMPWAERERPRRKAISFYDELFKTNAAITGRDAALEVIMGVGMVRGKIASYDVDHPIVEYRAEIKVDPITAAITIIGKDDSCDVFGIPAEDGSGAAAVMSAARTHWTGLPDACEISPFENLHWEPVLQAAASFLGSAGKYTPLAGSRELPTVSTGFKVFDSWVLLVRPSSLRPLLVDIAALQEELRSAETIDPLISLLDDPLNAEHLVQEMIDRVADLVRSATASVQVSAGGSSSTKQIPVSVAPYFPKLSNLDQEKIIRILQRGGSKGLVVQGPPGTGKSHSIANILCHALASGWRVLVAAHGDGPLQVLKGMLPVELRNLAINLSASEQSDVSQLEESVKAIAAIATKVDDPSAYVRNIEQTEQRIIANKTRLVEINECFLAWARDNLDYTETYSGRQTAASLAEIIVADKGTHDWFDDVIELRYLVPPIGQPEVGRLRAIRAQLGIDLGAFAWVIPEPVAITSEDDFVRIHGALKEAARLQGVSPKIHLNHLAGIADGREVAVKLLATIDRVMERAHLIKAKPWLSAWLEDAKRPLVNQLLVPSVDELLELMGAAVAAEASFIKAQVVVPKRPESLRQTMVKALGSEKPYSTWPFLRPSPEVAEAMDMVRVRGKAPVKEGWAEPLRYLDWIDANVVLGTRWNTLCDQFPMDRCPEANREAMAFFKALIDDIRQAEELLADLTSLNELSRPLSQALNGMKLDLRPEHVDETVSQLTDWRESIMWRIAQLDVAWAAARLGEVRTVFQKCVSPSCDEAKAMIEVLGDEKISDSDIAKAWRGILEKIERDRLKRTLAKELEECADKLALAGAVKWSQRIKSIANLDVNSAISNTDAVLPASWQDAWIWSAWKGKLEDGKSLKKIRELLAEKSAIDEELFRLMGTVVVLRTELQLSRLPRPLITKLTLFQNAVQRTGAGTGVRAARLRKEAKKLAAQCYEAVPCWIMPIKKVSETQPSKLGIFDLVIIDEASQCGPEAIPVIMRGKKVLIVGDDKQVSPTSFMAEEAYAHLHARFLTESPYRSALSPGASMYNLASAMFAGDNVRLREHFRCVEPIIRFSMRFYGEDANTSLVPLRIPKPSERLDPPIIDVFVPHGVAHGKTNPAEALVIAAEIERIVGDSAYDGKSIGVISLNGADQATVIEKAIMNRLGPEVFSKRNLLVADSSGFQGKERSIMFLSMVDAPNRRSMARVQDIYAQRYNVALSRARDRMYLVRSVTLEKLQNPKDMRRLAIQHFADPMPTESIRREATDDLIEKCDSGFERDVLARLLREGYDAVPQFPAAGYKIDIVVEGEDDRRLAIELDGDVYHPPEQYAKDMERQQQLERIGFKFWRCWWSEWILDPDTCYADLIAKLTTLGVKPLTGERKARSAYSAAFIADEQGRLFTPSEYAARENASSDETDQDVASDYLDAEFSEVGPNVNNYEQFGAGAGPNVLLLTRAPAVPHPLNPGDMLVVQMSLAAGDGECRTRHLQICTGSEVDLALGKIGASSGLGLALSQSGADESFEFVVDGQELSITIIAIRRAA